MYSPVDVVTRSLMSRMHLRILDSKDCWSSLTHGDRDRLYCLLDAARVHAARDEAPDAFACVCAALHLSRAMSCVVVSLRTRGCVEESNAWREACSEFSSLATRLGVAVRRAAVSSENEACFA